MARVNSNQHVVDFKNAVKARLLALRIAQQVVKGASKGLVAVRPFIVARVKEALSVPAPRKRHKDAEGNICYKATTRALPGAPPRKLSSRLRTSMVGLLSNENKTLTIGTNARGNPTKKFTKGFNYPRFHELGGEGSLGGGKHPFLVPTVRKWKKQIAEIVGKNIKLELR